MNDARLHSASDRPDVAEGSWLGTAFRVVAAGIVVGLPFWLLAHRFKALLERGTLVAAKGSGAAVGKDAARRSVISAWVPEMPPPIHQTTAYPTPPGANEAEAGTSSSRWTPEMGIPHHQTTAYPVAPPRYEAGGPARAMQGKS